MQQDDIFNVTSKENPNLIFHNNSTREHNFICNIKPMKIKILFHTTIQQENSITFVMSHLKNHNHILHNNATREHNIHL